MAGPSPSAIVKEDFDTAAREYVDTTSSSSEEPIGKIRTMFIKFNKYVNDQINKYVKNPLFAGKELTDQQKLFVGRLYGVIDKIKEQIINFDTVESKTPGIMGSIGGFFGMSGFRSRKYRNKFKKTRRSSRSRKSRK